MSSLCAQLRDASAVWRVWAGACDAQCLSMLLTHPVAPFYLNKMLQLSKLRVYITALANVLFVVSGTPADAKQHPRATYEWLHRLVSDVRLAHPTNTTLELVVPLHFEPANKLKFDKGSYIVLTEVFPNSLLHALSLCLFIVIINACALSARRARTRKCLTFCSLSCSFLVLALYAFFSRAHTCVLSDVEIALQGAARVHARLGCAPGPGTGPPVVLERMYMSAPPSPGLTALVTTTAHDADTNDYVAFARAYQKLSPEVVAKMVTLAADALLHTLVPKVNRILRAGQSASTPYAVAGHLDSMPSDAYG